MLFLTAIGVLITAIVLMSILGVRSPAGVHAAHLGWMSEQWLAEYRAAHPS